MTRQDHRPGRSRPPKKQKAGGAGGRQPAAPQEPQKRRRGVGVHLPLEEMARDMLRRAGDALVDPAEIARAVGGQKPEGWGPLMQPLRLALVKLAHEGSVTIFRKGVPADPDDFRGLYKVGRGPKFDEWEI
ncbi:DUF3253 domain-containing protein [Camelimonas abortus]|uniref:DUF3253 domain-containing protein n=1 Tax=Camelimonas abortus TaxID=1017184 RepID=A0ABV7LE92_9HYPH